jgi:polyhydroxybutyrate depolymerase
MIGTPNGREERAAMKVSSPLLGVLLLATTLCAPPCNADSMNGSIDVNGVQRTWQLFVPPRYDAKIKHALVLDFHGSGGSPQGQSRNSGFTRLAADKTFLVVNPAGVYRRSADSGLTWNVDLDPRGVDDVRFVRTLIAHLQQQYSLDPNRIYATGFSGGARMSSRLACDASDLIAAVGVVSGIRFPQACSPQRSVPILATHSENDEVNHFDHRPDSPTYWPEGVSAAIAKWAKHHGCGAANEERMSFGVTRVAYQNCSADLVLLKLQDGGHTWPGSPAAKQLQASGQSKIDPRFSATEAIWHFFDTHPRSQH